MKVFIPTEIANPIAPIIKSPTAETFETVLNSIIVGFLRRRQTLRYWWYCEDNFLENPFIIFGGGVLGF
jgi:hypothetical protein